MPKATGGYCCLSCAWIQQKKSGRYRNGGGIMSGLYLLIGFCCFWYFVITMLI
jgi:hypothetical protein